MNKSIRWGMAGLSVLMVLLGWSHPCSGQFGGGGLSFGASGHAPGGSHTPNGPGFMPHIPSIPHVPNIPYVPPVTPTPHYPTPSNYVPNYVPNHVPNYVPPIQPNTVTPQVTPETNVVVADIGPEQNDPWGHVTPITPEQLEDWKKQIDKKTDDILQELSKLAHDKIPDIINHVHDQIDHGKLTPETVIDLIHQIEPFVPNDPAKQTQISGLVDQLITNNRLKFIFINININIVININAWWNFGIIFWIPGLPWGQVIILNNGWWFAGMGFGDDIWCYPGYLPQAAGLPYALGPPVPESALERVSSGVLLINGTEAAVNYSVDGQSFTMQPKWRQALPAGRTWTVAFDRGGSFGSATYGLTDGTYKFTATERGLDLFRHQFQVTIDNSANPFVFRYVLDNARQSLAAKQTQAHSGNYPIEIRFDDGAGQIKKKVVETGAFKVAVGKDNKLDLFKPEGVTLPMSAEELTKKHKPPTVNLFADTKKLTPSLFQTGLPQLPAQPAPTAAPAVPTTPNLFEPAKK